MSAAAAAKAAAAAGAPGEPQQDVRSAARSAQEAQYRYRYCEVLSLHGIDTVYSLVDGAWVLERGPVEQAIEEGEAVRTKCKAKVAIGNGRRLRLSLGVNVVAALQRNERLGRSWRGSWEVG